MATMKASTFFGLMAEFGSSQIPLAACCRTYFGCNEPQAKTLAARNALPVPAFKLGGKKSGWFIKAEELAEHIDHQSEIGRKRWEAAH